MSSGFYDYYGLSNIICQISSNFRGTEVVNLKNKRICQDVAVEIGRALSINHTVKKLDLGWNRLGPEGAHAIAEALLFNTSLTELNIERNDIGTKGMVVLCDAILQRNNNANTSGIQKLHVGCNNIGEEGLDAIAKLLEDSSSNVDKSLSLCELSLGPHNKIAPSSALSIAEALRVNSSLKVLKLQMTCLRTEGVIPIANALAINATLEELSLVKNSIGIAGAEALADALRVNNSLIKLDLSVNRIGTDGFVALSTALEMNRHLKYLGVAANKIETNGAVALSNVLRDNQETALEQIHMMGNSISAEGFSALAHSLKFNTTVKKITIDTPRRGNNLDLANVRKSLKLIRMYERLNQLGRENLVVNSNNRDKWMNVLIKASDDLDCIFFLVTFNPHIWLNADIFSEN